MTKLTHLEYKYLQEIIDNREEWIREGQAWFNEVYLLNPELADSVRSTQSDPFYDNKKINNFLQTICNEECLTQLNLK